MASRKIYFDKKKDAVAEFERRHDFGVSVRRVPYGRHKGRWVICSYIGFINEMYGQ